jgi:TetR/AcrR family transcriptional regulator, regulator of cefoperazone and chloramphenicol sensitivity
MARKGAKAKATPPSSGRNTRQRLLEVAGEVFAEKGFHRATGKEICTLAQANVAAINYHFGSIEGLYEAAIEEANRRLISLEAVSAAVAGKADARAQLEAVLRLLVTTLLGPASKSWTMRLLGREIVAPSSALDSLRERELLPKSRILRTIVAELSGLPVDDPAVARISVNIMAPCFMLLVCDRRTLRRMFPRFGFAADDAEAIVQHMLRFALAGLTAAKR